MRNRIGQPATVLAMAVAAVLAAGSLAGCGEPVGPVSAAPSRPSVPPGFVPLAFTAISATHWWVLGSVPSGRRDRPVIVTTRGALTLLSPAAKKLIMNDRLGLHTGGWATA